MSKQLTAPDRCKNKQTYWSYKTGKRAAQRRSKAAGYKYLRAYNCNVCHFWHLTTQKRVEE